MPSGTGLTHTTQPMTHFAGRSDLPVTRGGRESIPTDQITLYAWLRGLQLQGNIQTTPGQSDGHGVRLGARATCPRRGHAQGAGARAGAARSAEGKPAGRQKKRAGREGSLPAPALSAASRSPLTPHRSVRAPFRLQTSSRTVRGSDLPVCPRERVSRRIVCRPRRTLRGLQIATGLPIHRRMASTSPV